jgi:hypothetical protein
MTLVLGKRKAASADCDVQTLYSDQNWRRHWFLIGLSGGVYDRCLLVGEADQPLLRLIPEVRDLWRMRPNRNYEEVARSRVHDRWRELLGSVGLHCRLTVKILADYLALPEAPSCTSK